MRSGTLWPLLGGPLPVRLRWCTTLCICGKSHPCTRPSWANVSVATPSTPPKRPGMAGWNCMGSLDPWPFTYWCLAGNGWEWGTGMIIDSYCGAFPHSLRFAPVSLEKEKVNPNGLQNSHRTNRRTAGNMITLSVTSFTPPTSSSSTNIHRGCLNIPPDWKWAE